MRRALSVLLLVACAVAGPAAAQAPDGQLTWAYHITIAPTWFDPADTPAIITPFTYYYAIHDALVKPMPGQPLAPSLAESWTVTPDGLAYDFTLRKGVRFHNGDVFTADDVKFSFERYRGGAAAMFKARIAAVEVIDPQHVRFRLRQPWPDFMTFFGTPATGIAWIVPKKYVERVGDDGFRKAPVGAGPYRFVSYTPGVELVLEAFDQYWRKTPSVRRLVFRIVTDDATRLAMLKRGEADIAHNLNGPLAEEARRTPGVTLKAIAVPANFWLVFTEQWSPKSPWHDRRVRLAANHAIDRAAISQAESLGFSRPTGSIIPATFDFYWPAPLYAFDPGKARQLLAEAGYPGGFDAGEFFCDQSFANVGEAVSNYLKAVGIRTRLRPLERAAFFGQYREKKLRPILQSGSAAFGNAATRLEAFVAAGGMFTYGSYPDIEGLFHEQATELDVKKREAILHRLQQLIHDKTMFAPIWELAFISAHGPRVAESGLGLITNLGFSSPYEELKLKAK